MTEQELKDKIAGLGELDEETRNKVVCSLIGHSKIVTYCFGYVNCSRCEAQLGDTMVGGYSAEEDVIVKHDCETCRTNFAKLGWKDKLFAPHPFKGE